MARQFAIIVFTLLLSGCVDIPKFEPQHWEVIPLHGNQSAGNTAILLNKQTGETWIAINGSNVWSPMQR